MTAGLGADLRVAADATSSHTVMASGSARARPPLPAGRRHGPGDAAGHHGDHELAAAGNGPVSARR